MIRVGEIEHEWTNPAEIVLFFHRWCMILYRDME